MPLALSVDDDLFKSTSQNISLSLIKLKAFSLMSYPESYTATRLALIDQLWNLTSFNDPELGYILANLTYGVERLNRDDRLLVIDKAL